MDDLLTATQIEVQFQSEWILVEDPQTDESWKSGAVRYAGTPRTETRSIARRWSCV